MSNTPENTCHACGHDAHVAMLPGAAKILEACKAELQGIIYFCFEEGEKTGGGVAAMLAIYPGVYAHLGINNPAYGSGTGHHNTYFDVDENVLKLGVTATVKYVDEVGKKGNV